MRKVAIRVGFSAAVIVGGLAPGYSADYYSRPAGPSVAGPMSEKDCQPIMVCGPYSCGYRQICHPNYSATYLGHSLYGAYGPYGGSSYWGAYTGAGWGIR
jgi:hypothetical protein